MKWTFAPMVDIARDPRWGRISEGSGEDPFLGAAMARARVRGFQGDDPAAPDRVLACAKHWVAYGAAEGGRDYNSADLSEQTLRTIYFPPFRAALEAGAGSFMSSFNTDQWRPRLRQPVHAHTGSPQGMALRRPRVSDYESVKELLNHGIAADGADAARQALVAGIDMEMVSRLFAEHLPEQVDQGVVPRSGSTRPCAGCCGLKFRLGLFERPYADESLRGEGRREPASTAPRPAQLAAAVDGIAEERTRRSAASSPRLRSIAVLGPLADDRDAPLSHWRGDGRVEDVVTLLAGIEARAAKQAGIERHSCQGVRDRRGLDRRYRRGRPPGPRG